MRSARDRDGRAVTDRPRARQGCDRRPGRGRADERVRSDSTRLTAGPAARRPDADPDDGARPTALLPLTQLLRISAYWLGLTAIDAAVGLFILNRVEFDGLVPKDEVGRSLFLIGIGGAIIGIIIQPTVGYISDYTVSKWGRRKPYIVFGSLLDVVFLLGIATGNSVLVLATFVLLLSVSTNIARGPFQGYVPDLVAEPQVGLASGMVGLMQVVGNVTGFLLVSLSVYLGVMELSLVAVALVELVTMASVVLKVGKGMPPKPRHGKSWREIAREAWATDILRNGPTCGCWSRACCSWSAARSS